jgi:hypothetical protein
MSNPFCDIDVLPDVARSDPVAQADYKLYGPTPSNGKHCATLG